MGYGNRTDNQLLIRPTNRLILHMLTLGFWSHKSHKINLFADLIYKSHEHICGPDQ